MAARSNAITMDVHNSPSRREKKVEKQSDMADALRVQMAQRRGHTISHSARGAPGTPERKSLLEAASGGTRSSLHGDPLLDATGRASVADSGSVQVIWVSGLPYPPPSTAVIRAAFEPVGEVQAVFCSAALDDPAAKEWVLVAFVHSRSVADAVEAAAQGQVLIDGVRLAVQPAFLLESFGDELVVGRKTEYRTHSVNDAVKKRRHWEATAAVWVCGLTRACNSADLFDE